MEGRVGYKVDGYSMKLVATAADRGVDENPTSPAEVSLKA